MSVESSLAGKQIKTTSDKTCDICGRSFARNEHLVRHRLTHTSEKPYFCPLRLAIFPRADVKEKHMKTMHPTDGRPAGAMTSKPKERSKLACDHCRKGKLKCDSHHPCQSCRIKQIQCTISASSRSPGRPKTSSVRNIVRHGGTELMDTNPTALAVSNTSIASLGPNLPAFVAGTDGSIDPVQFRRNNEELSTTPMSRRSPAVGAGQFLPVSGEMVTTATNSMSPVEDGLFFNADDASGFVGLDFFDTIWQIPSLDVSEWLDGLDNMPSALLGSMDCSQEIPALQDGASKMALVEDG